MILPAKRALEKIVSGTIAPGYLLLGTELYWRDQVWTALRSALGLEGSATGLAEVDLRQTSLGSVLAQASERNLWAARQLILIRSAHSLSGTKARQSLAEYFRDPNPDTVLLFEMTDVDLDTEDWREREKAKSRQEQWGDICTVILLVSPSEKEALELIRREVSEKSCRIAGEAASHLVALMGCDLGRIVRELEKLCLFRGQREEITLADVELLTGSSGGSQGISMVEAVGTGNPAKLFASIQEQIPQGAYLPLVLGEITRYLRQLMLLQQRRARDTREASSLLWSARLPAAPNLLPELMRQSRTMPRRHLAHCLRKVLYAEVALRSSPADDRMIVERLLLTISEPLRSKGMPGSSPRAVSHGQPAR